MIKTITLLLVVAVAGVNLTACQNMPLKPTATVTVGHGL